MSNNNRAARAIHQRQIATIAGANGPTYDSFITWTETPGVSTAATIFASGDPLNGNTPNDARRKNQITGPAIALPPATTANYGVAIDGLRAQALDALCAQMLATPANFPPGFSWPNSIITGGPL